MRYLVVSRDKTVVIGETPIVKGELFKNYLKRLFKFLFLTDWFC